MTIFYQTFDFLLLEFVAKNHSVFLIVCNFLVILSKTTEETKFELCAGKRYPSQSFS